MEMKTTITVRHTTIPDEIKERANELLEKIERKVGRPQSANVVFDEDHGLCVVEIQLHLARGRYNIAKGEASDFRTALDAAAQKLAHQIDRGTTSVVRA